MKLIGFLVLVLALSNPGKAFSQENNIFSGVNFQQGPFVANLCGVSSINIPSGCLFVDKNDAGRFLEALHNIPARNECGIILSKNENWFMKFRYIESGHILDDEKGKLNASALLETLRKNNDQANIERKKRGWGQATLTGWEVPPHYDQITNNLEWGVRCLIEGDTSVNYNIRLLGREGLMTVVCVVAPQSFQQSIINFRSIISNFSFKQGEKYAEYRQGDKLAQYGLTALIVGGATAVAVKSGLGKWLGKIIVVGVMASFGYIVSLFKRKK